MLTEKKTIITHSLDETHQLGQIIGNLLPAGAILTLTGDLGSGKTSFVQGLARGLDVPADYYVTSPTYNIINEYPGRYPLFHIDLYRIGQTSKIEDLSDLEDIGFEEILHSGGVVAIEWANMLPENLLPLSMALQFEIIDDTSRKICIVAYGLEAVNLLKKLDLNSTPKPSEEKQWA